MEKESEMSKNLMREFSELFSRVENMDELRCVAEMYRQTSRKIQLLESLQFKKGDKVKFADRRRGTIVEGTVTKVNSKTIVVLAGNTSWRVSPSLLSAA